MRRINNIKSLILIILVIAVITGISYYWIANAQKRTMEKQIIAMQGMRINLDFENVKATFNGIDSSFFSKSVKKLVIFVDSTSCSGCFLSHLVNYLEINSSLIAHDGQLVVVLHPKQGRLEEIKTIMRKERFPFWCIVDSTGEFVKNNPMIPENPLLHTFSLNDNNNVILVGDPTRNERIKELFYQEVIK